jgi:hypothetical protein
MVCVDRKVGNFLVNKVSYHDFPPFKLKSF